MKTINKVNKQNEPNVIEKMSNFYNDFRKSNLIENFFKSKIQIYFSFVILCFVFYGNTIMHDFTVDDYYVTGRNQMVRKGINAIPEIFTTHYHDMGKKNTFEYRPMVKAVYAIENNIFGTNPYVNHFFNILWYALNCIIIFNVLRRLMWKFNIIFPYIITVLYIAHPVHTEVLNSLKNRDEILSFIGSLLTLIYFIRYIETNKVKNIVIGVLYFWFGLLSKSSGVAFMVLIPLTIRFFYDTKLWKLLMLFCILTVAYYAFRYIPDLYLPEAYRDKEFYENPLMFERSMFTRFASGLYVLLFYVKLLVFPHPLIYYYGFDMIPVVKITNFWAILSILIHSSMFVYAVWNYRNKSFLSFAIIFYLIIMSEYSNIVKPAMGIVAERFLYIAVLPYFMIIIFLLFKILKIDVYAIEIPKVSMSKIKIMLLIFLAPFAMKTIARNTSWKDNTRLVANDIRYAERSFIVNKSYANQLSRELSKVRGQSYLNKLDSIVFYYKRAIDIYPSHGDPWSALGQIYVGRKEYDKALPYFLKAVEIHPDKFSYNFYNLGLCYQMMDNDSAAVRYYLRAVEITAEDRGYYQLAYSYTKMGKFSDAIIALKTSLELNPEYTPAYYSLGFCHEQLGHLEKAEEYYHETLKRDALSMQSAAGLSRIYQQTGNEEDAIYYDKLAMKLKEKNEERQKKKAQERQEMFSEE